MYLLHSRNILKHFLSFKKLKLGHQPFKIQHVLSLLIFIWTMHIIFLSIFKIGIMIHIKMSLNLLVLYDFSNNLNIQPIQRRFQKFLNRVGFLFCQLLNDNIGLK